MFKRTYSLVALILFIAVGVAQGQVTITYSSKGIQHFTMAVADDWRVNVGSETDLTKTPEEERGPARLISAMPNSGVPLWFGMWVPEELAKIEDATEYMDSLGLDLLTDVTTTERRSDTLNSMEVYYVSGTGNKEGEAMDFRAAYFQLSEDRVAIAIYIGPRETTISHGEELVQMIQSLQPITQ